MPNKKRHLLRTPINGPIKDNTPLAAGETNDISPARHQKNWIIISIFVFYLAGAHFRSSLHSGGEVIVPMFMMVFSTLAMTFWFLPALWKHAGLFITLLITFLAIQPWLGMEITSLDDVIKNVLQLTTSVIGAAAILYGINKVDRNTVVRALMILWTIAIFASLAEVHILKGFFDDLRTVIYSEAGRGIYFADDRDLDIYGRVRATALASEPSFLADTLSTLCIMVFLLYYKTEPKKAWLILIFMVVVSFYLVPSFKTLFYMLALFVWINWPKTALHTLYIFTSAVALLLLFYYLSDDIANLIIYMGGGHMETGSFFGRVGSAHIVGLHALSTYPIFGYGIGNRDSVYPLIVDVWNYSGAFILFPWYADAPAEGLLSNGFWWMWIYLGVLGGAFFLFLTRQILCSIGVQYPLRSITCAAITWYAGAAFVDPQSWCVVVAFSISAFTNESRRAYCPNSQILQDVKK